jgi:hypothetical protein
MMMNRVWGDEGVGRGEMGVQVCHGALAWEFGPDNCHVAPGQPLCQPEQKRRPDDGRTARILCVLFRTKSDEMRQNEKKSVK